MVHVVCALDRGYIQHFCSMIASLSKHTKENVTIHVIHNNFTLQEEQFIARIFSYARHVQFSYYQIDDSDLQDINIISEHLTIQTLYRLLVGDILSPTIEKVIYLDCDLIVEEDISMLYNQSLDGYVLGAVNEWFETIKSYVPQQDLRDYFNAGVLLLDLKKWRAENFLQKCLHYARKYPERLYCGDQDILNGIIQGAWKRLDFRWNVTRDIFEQKEKYQTNYPSINFEKILTKPYIVHFTTHMKPWLIYDNHPYQKQYFVYLEEIGYICDLDEKMKLIKNKNIVIFGAGSFGERVKQELEAKGFNVVFFCDNDSNKWGKPFLNVDVISPNQLLAIEHLFIVVASTYADEISHQLTKMGLTEYKTFSKAELMYKMLL